ncbi:glycoside hydrolase family 25 protein [Pelomyxa schiedti]|nr:glycoside hydrolase family 25 protein [Pelomyxa schiedti]
MRLCVVGIVLVCLVGLEQVYCYSGIDMSSTLVEANAECLVSKGYHFTVSRCFRSNGEVDTAVVASSKAAWNGGMSYFDVYFFPCFSCGDPAGQVSTSVQYLTSNSVKYGMMWFDVEGPGTYWGNSTSANQNFFTSLVAQAKSMGVTIGVYTSKSQWQPIMGSSYTGGAAYPLWYAHYDNNPSFSDYVAFGGWTTPSVKQYEGTTSLCNQSVDLDWYP